MIRNEQNMNPLKGIADNTSQNSYASKMRRKRFEVFWNLLENTPKPIELIDIGGTQLFWEVMGYTDIPDIHITILNLDKPVIKHKNFSGIAGDATDLAEISDNQYDIVFSNSVIEHVGDFNQQKKMAQEVRRVGKRYFVQTPNYFFPIEPHFLFPGFQWLPLSTRTFLINHFNLGWIKKESDPVKARETVEDIRLLRKHDLISLFPQAKLYEEKLFGLTKSFVVYDGW